jgi:hypothetical protein
MATLSPRLKGGPDFTLHVARQLQDRAGNHCSNPACRQLTSTVHSDPSRAIRLGEAAHIRAARKGAARFDPAMTDAMRAEPANGIWLCRQCHVVIDRDEGGFPPSLLIAWRQVHDAWVLEHTRLGGSTVPAMPWHCTNCGVGFDEGLRLCRGCHSVIFWGATKFELARAAELGTALGVGLGAFLCIGVPLTAGYVLATPVPFFLGMDLWAIPVVFALSLVGRIGMQVRLRRRLSRAGPRIQLPPGY